MRLPEESEISRPSVNILPMIDVIFAILAFFILSTLYLTKSEGLPVTLPEATTATPQDSIDVTLTITADGDLFLADQAVGLSELASRVLGLRQAAIAPNQPVEQSTNRPIFVTVRADTATPHGRVVAAMDQLQTVDGIRLGIATVQP
ncbi:MAG: biopolymer transporter ExbD [Phormidesmis sp.]